MELTSLTLYFVSLHLLSHRDNRVEFKKLLPLLIVYFILSTIYMIMLAAFTQMSFVDDRKFPGGLGTYKDVMYYVPVDKVNSNYQIR